MSEEDSKLEQLGAAAKNAGQAVVETLKDDEKRGAIVQTVVDGAESAVDKLTNTLNNAALGIKSLTKDDLTAENIAKIAQEKGPDAVVEAIKAAGYFSLFKGPTQIAAMLAGDNGASKLADVISGKAKPDEKSQAQSGLDLMAILSGDFSSLSSMKDKAVSSIDGLKNLLSGGIGEKLAGWWPDFDIPSITGMLDSFKQSALALFDSFFGSGNTIESNGQEMLADTANDSQTPPSRKSGAGLDGAQRPAGDFDRVASTSAPQAAPHQVASNEHQPPEGPAV